MPRKKTQAPSEVVVQMSCTVLAKELSTAIAACREINNHRTGLLLRCEEEKLVVNATDSQTWVRVNVQSIVAVAGEAYLVSRQEFTRAISRMSGEVSLVVSNDVLHVSHESGELSFAVLDPTDHWPSIPVEITCTQPPIPITELLEKEAFLFCPSRNGASETLAGVSLRASDGECVAAVTDGHRLSKCVLATPDSTKFDVIIQPQVLSVANQLRTKMPADMGLELSLYGLPVCLVNILHMKGEIYSRVIEGTYPDYERLIPVPMFGIEVDRAELLASVEILTLLSDQILIAVGAEAVTLHSKSNFRGEGEETLCYIDTESFSANGWRLAFAGAYLIDALKHFKGRTVRVSSTGYSSPVLISDPDANGEDLHLVMPIKNEDFAQMPHSLSEVPADESLHNGANGDQEPADAVASA